MSDVETKSPLELALEDEKRKEKEKEEAKQRKAAGVGNFEFEELKVFGLEDKKAKVCRLLGNPVQIRQKATDPKYVLHSQILDDTKKSFAHINWPIVEKDGRFIPDKSWVLTKLLDKVMEGKWTKYEDGHIDDKGKNGSFIRYYTNTSIYKRVEGNSRPKDQILKKFYPSLKVVTNCIDRHDTWCKDNKHSKLLISKSSKYEGSNDKGEKFEIYFNDVGIPSMCYDVILTHLTHCSGVKSLSDIDTVIIRDGKSVTKQFYLCFDKSDYPKYFSDKIAFELASNEPLSFEENSYELYDLDRFYGVSSYAKLKKRLIGLFKLCDAELGSSFEQELEQLVKEEAASKPKEENVNSKPSEDVQEVAEEKYDSIAEESEPINTANARSKRAEQVQTKPSDTASISIESFCIKNFPKWNDLSPEEKVKMIGYIESFDGSIPVYKKNANEMPCAKESCNFIGTKHYTEFPGDVLTCPVCGNK